MDEKVLLIVDGHKSHTHNIKALEIASKCGVIMLSLPPHTTHKLQPLDLCFFKPLKTYYYQYINQWMRTHPGRPVTMFQICQLFGKAYGKAATVGNAVNGFCKCGIFPLNPFVFDDSEFQPAEVNDRPNPVEIENTNSVTLVSTSFSNANKASNDSNSPNIRNNTANDDTTEVNVPKNKHCSHGTEINISVAEISPLPKQIETASQKRRSSAKSTILTSTPHKKRVKDQAKPTQKIKPKKVSKASLYECIVCNEAYDEDWIQCQKCKKWAHEACADLNNPLYYFCDNCSVYPLNNN